MDFSALIMNTSGNAQQIIFLIFIFILKQVWSAYTVNIASQSTLVNPGDKFVAYCNIPGQGPLDIISDLKVQWFHNGRLLTNLCEFVLPELVQDYSCKVLSPQQNNISFELSITSVRKADAGNLTCEVFEKVKDYNDKWLRDEMVAKKSVTIQVREPIKGMKFQFDASSKHALTLANNQALHQMEVVPGRYAPSCQVMGSIPAANIRIMIGDKMMEGRIVKMEDMLGTQFVADETDFRDNSQVNVMCSADVEGLPNSKIERTFQIVVRQKPIKSMKFQFDPSINYALTLDNNELLHKIEVLPGRYAPSCQVMGSMHAANVRIMMGDKMMEGRIVKMKDTLGTQFVADETDFRDNSQVNVMCSADVEGLPNSKIERTFQIVVRQKPIKSMKFQFDPSINYALTLDNNELLHKIEVLPGRYAPSCQVMGSMHAANVRIMMGDKMMEGRIVKMKDTLGTQFVADETDFRDQ